MSLLVAIPALFPDLVRRAAPLLLYHPARLPADRSAPSAWGLPRGQEVVLRRSGEPTLHGWWIPARTDDPCATLLFLHGNAGNVAGRADVARDLTARGLHVMLLDYRGYGRSEGNPSEDGLYRDARAAYRHLREEREIPPERLVVGGHSLGGAVAAHLASREPAAAVVLTATFTDLSAAARAVYPWLPSAWFDWDPPPFPTRRRVAELSNPTLLGRGGRDRLIPARQVEALYRAAPEPRGWIEVPEADHGGLWHHRRFQDALLAFLSRHVTGCAPADGTAG